MKFTIKKLICFIVILALVVGLIIGNISFPSVIDASEGLW